MADKKKRRPRRFSLPDENAAMAPRLLMRQPVFRQNQEV